MYSTAGTKAFAFSFILFVFIFSLFPLTSIFGQGNEYTSAVSLSSSTSCTIPTSGNPNYTLDNAVPSSGVPAGCVTGGNGNHYDVWFSFSAASATETVTIGNFGSNVTNPEVQIFSGTAYANFISRACGSTSATATSLTVGTTYYIRVSNVGTDPSGNGQTPKFDICLTHPTPPPSNDDCSGATTLTSGTINSSGTVWSATASSSIPVGCATGDPDDDVWYKFTTSSTSNSLTITLSSIGTNLSSSGTRIQLFTGGCGSLSSYACGTITLTTSVSGSTTYYIRVYSAGTGSIGGTSSGSAFSITATAASPTVVTSGRMNEVFQETILSDNGVLNYPWEVTYGPDNMLWLTEARGYKVYRMDPGTGAKTTVLDVSQGSTWLPSPSDSLNVQFSSSQNPWPQGGLAGLAVHPQFLDGTGLHDFVYVSYVHRYLYTASGSAGIFFRNKIVRFTYNSGTGKLGSPAVVCDTIPGGQDHNSQRMIIAPVTSGGTNYLFYAAGDMGSGQFSNRMRPQNAQDPTSYEGKILRFNLEPVAGSWIPSDNPYSSTSAVYGIGIRNNQGFAYDTLTNKLYGASHGPYSDDEINVIESRRNYGHPLIEGFVDGNYDGTSLQGTDTSVSAGAPYTDAGGVSTCQPIGSESANKIAINANGNGLYKDPLFSAYAVPGGTTTTPGTVKYIWKNNPGNASPAPGWPTEAWSGLDLYSNKLIPGWKRSLVAASLKWGRLVRLKLSTTGDATAPTNTVSDTVTYLNSKNRFRDLAFAPNGKDIFVIMDNTSTTSGPGNANPVVPSCAGCVIKYTFLGYAHNNSTNRSTIPTSIDITSGTTNTLTNGTTITIDATNSNYWVPITGPDGNIMAEIKANGNVLGTVTSTFYTSGTVREDANKRLYLNRSITLTPQNQPASTVNVRLYITTAELTALTGATNSQGAGSNVSGISDLKVLKNNDANSTALTAATTTITPTYAEAFAGTSNGGYVLQADITSFSSFYFENPGNIVLPLELVSFKGTMKENNAYLNWESANENNTSHFVVERSIDGQNFEAIGKVNATGNATESKYGFIDYDAGKQSSSTIYYRLKIMDKDQAFTYSQIISLSISSTMPITAYPNPVNDVLNLKLTVPTNDRIHIQVTDMQGRIIYTKTKSVRAGTEEIKINTKSWAAQSYFINVYDSKNKILFAQKLVKNN